MGGSSGGGGAAAGGDLMSQLKHVDMSQFGGGETSGLGGGLRAKLQDPAVMQQLQQGFGDARKMTEQQQPVPGMPGMPAVDASAVNGNPAGLARRDAGPSRSDIFQAMLARRGRY